MINLKVWRKHENFRTSSKLKQARSGEKGQTILTQTVNAMGNACRIPSIHGKRVLLEAFGLPIGYDALQPVYQTGQIPVNDRQ